MKKGILIIMMVMVLGLVSACANKENKAGLDPDKPITVTVWHYYNGNIKESFDELITVFNETVGMDQGIVIDAQSQGDVNNLADAVFDAANESIGASPLPNIFASYADNAFRVNQIVPLVKLNTYFTQDELATYRLEFIEEGMFITDEDYYILPVAKSSENLYVNKTDWEPFAKEHGFTTDDLRTWEGISRVAKAYYEATGKGFFSLDAAANYFMVASMQAGEEIYTYHQDGSASIQFSKDLARKIWDYYYTPYINGYFVKTGRFSSDDAKTGTVIAYTGSTAGAAYFPMVVSQSDEVNYPVEPLVLPYPVFESGQPVTIQQGAGMCITQSDEAHEYASAVFLKWFTESQQNMKFAVSTGYFPVKVEALSTDKMLETASGLGVETPAIIESIKASSEMFNNYTFYNAKAFNGSYEVRKLLETQLMNKINADLLTLSQVAASQRDTQIVEMTSDSAFNQWYDTFVSEATTVLTTYKDGY